MALHPGVVINHCPAIACLNCCKVFTKLHIVCIEVKFKQPKKLCLKFWTYLLGVWILLMMLRLKVVDGSKTCNLVKTLFSNK